MEPMKCEHDWVDGACGATAPLGTPGWERRTSRNGGEFWLCPESIAEMPSDEEMLNSAVRNAKARAGLDPDRTYHPAEFIDHLEEQWHRPFWDRQIDRVTAGEFVPNHTHRSES